MAPQSVPAEIPPTAGEPLAKNDAPFASRAVSPFPGPIADAAPLPSTQPQPSAATMTALAPEAGAAPRAEVTAQPPAVDPQRAAPVLEQVRAAIEARGTGHRIEVQLDPPELGRVQIDFEMSRHGSMRAVVSAVDAETLELLRRQGGSLVDDLRQEGFGDVDLSWSGGDASPHEDSPSAQAKRDRSSPVLTAHRQAERHDGAIDIQL